MKKLLLEALKAIKEKPLSQTMGICGNVTAYAQKRFTHLHDCMLIDAKHEEMRFLIRKLISQWPDKKGNNLETPIEGSIMPYLDDSEHERLWTNPRRHELLDWMIKELENG